MTPDPVKPPNKLKTRTLVIILPSIFACYCRREKFF